MGGGVSVRIRHDARCMCLGMYAYVLLSIGRHPVRRITDCGYPVCKSSGVKLDGARGRRRQ